MKNPKKKNPSQKNEKLKMDLFYWAMILASCSMGEAVGDFLSHGPMQLGYFRATIFLLCIVITSLYIEKKTKVSSLVKYWTTIITMSTAGTTLADYLSRTLKMGYFWTTLALLITFFSIIALWKRGSLSNKSLLTHLSIKTDNRYWLAIMVASTLGTTLGDALTNGTKLGFGGGTALLVSLLSVILFLECQAKLLNEFRYWLAIILTSTIGATSGDFITKDISDGGLGYGYYKGIGIIFLVFLITASVGKKFYSNRM